MEYKGIELKSMEGWDAFATTADNGGIDKYMKPGDLVDESVWDNFLNVLPPHRWTPDYLQCGEPYDHTYNPEKNHYAPTFTTFKRIDKDVYMYLGNCFTEGFWDSGAYKFDTIAEFLEKTYRVNPATKMQETRPHIFCKDGFEFSVQAGDGLYCRPRRNGKTFEAAEIGFPSKREELLDPYAEEIRKPTKSIYPFVPLKVAEEVLKKHNQTQRT